jgi:hypothetical protein
MFWRTTFLFLTLSAGVFAADEPRVMAVPAEVRARFILAPFYQKYVGLEGLPIIASGKVSDFALLEARYVLANMTAFRPELARIIARAKVRVAVMATDEFSTDIPEHHDLKPKDYWDRRARGLGATLDRPAVSCGEENLLGYAGDPYPTENILVHEFGHVIHERGLYLLDGNFDRQLRAAFEAAQRAGLWQGTYAGTNHKEYWAEGVQSWFDTNRENDSDHNAINTRTELKVYDPGLAALLAKVFGDGEWRYVPPVLRKPPSPHLQGLDPAQAPTFAWPERIKELPAKAP